MTATAPQKQCDICLLNIFRSFSQNLDTLHIAREYAGLQQDSTHSAQSRASVEKPLAITNSSLSRKGVSEQLMSRLLTHVEDLAGYAEPSVRSLDLLMSLEIRRNSCEKIRHADEP